MRKRAEINLPFVLLIILMLVVLAGLGFFIYKIYSDNSVSCGIGKLQTIDGEKVCVYDIKKLPSALVCEKGDYDSISGKCLIYCDTACSAGGNENIIVIFNLIFWL